MTAEYKAYIVGTRDRPTMFMMLGGELSEDFEDAQLMILREDAEEEIRKCDEPEQFQVYEAIVSVDGI